MCRFLLIIMIAASIAFASRGERRSQREAMPRQAEIQSVRPAVAVSVPALGALSREILNGVAVDVLEPFGVDFTIGEFEGIALEYAEILDEIAPRVTAVAGIRSILPSDPLFAQLRHRNIRIVEIDCAIPPSPVGSAIGIVRFENTQINPFAWLSLSNAVRMAEILESDFRALFPQYADRISANLLDFKQRAFALRNEYARKFLQVDNFSAVALSANFDYLLKDINIFVPIRLGAEDAWSAEETQRFRYFVENAQVSVVINAWQTDAPASEIMEKHGIKTAVLRTGFPAGSNFEEGFLAFYERNLAALAAALEIND